MSTKLDSSSGEDKTLWEVEKILKKREVNGYVEYEIKWSGKDEFGNPWDNSWEPQVNIQSQTLIEEFEKCSRNLYSKMNVGKRSSMSTCDFQSKSSKKVKSEDKTLWEVEKILNKREENGYVEYEIKWSGRDETGNPWDNSWEPQVNIQSPTLIAEFEKCSQNLYSKQNVDKRSSMFTGDLESKSYKKGKSEDETLWEVEKILNKREENGYVEYEIVWSGKDEAGNPWDNSWELQENIHKTLIEKFEKSSQKNVDKRSSMSAGAKSSKKVKYVSSKEPQGFDRGLKAESILGAMANEDGELLFLIKWKGSYEADLVHYEKVYKKIPQMALEFYHKELTFYNSDDEQSPSVTDLVQEKKKKEFSKKKVNSKFYME